MKKLPFISAVLLQYFSCFFDILLFENFSNYAKHGQSCLRISCMIFIIYSHTNACLGSATLQVVCPYL